jgi:LacI family transcriptional regulator
MTPRILYLNHGKGVQVQKLEIAGIHRYAAARGWGVVAVPTAKSSFERIPDLLSANNPVIGCVIEGHPVSGKGLPPALFGSIPVVYLHVSPSLYGKDAIRVEADNEAIARAAFGELSAGRPAAYAVIGFWGDDVYWSGARMRVFASLVAEAGAPCASFPGTLPGKERSASLAAWVAQLPSHTAVFAVNDVTAAEVIAAARRAGRLIPRDLTLVGVDNDPAICEASSPKITSIQLDHERSGYVAARIVGESLSREATLRARSDHLNGEAALNGCGGLAAATIGPLLVVRRESTGGYGRREPYITRAVEIIRREACDGLTAAVLAARMPGSRRLLEMRFREAMGHSILDEIMHVRLEKVETLLAGTDTAIGAIADFCGFGSEVELRQIFHARTGMSMREWRKRNR